jgi:peptidoglycan/LPS O-acetylase OafA/YrhL
VSDYGQADRQRFSILDGSRGIAALVVVAVHGAITTGLIPMGPLAVDYFFVLSGFVLGYAYERRLRSGVLSVSRYFAIRWVRLYPMLAFGTLFGACAVFGQWASWHQYDKIIPALPTLAAGLLLLPVSPHYTPVYALMPMPLAYTPFYAKLTFPFDIPVWSLFFEIIATIAFPLMRRFLVTPILMVFVVLTGLGLSHAILAHGDAFFGWTWNKIPDGLWRLSFSFGMGLLIFRLFKPGRFVIPKRYAVLPLALLLVVLLMPFDRASHHFAAAQIFVVIVCLPALVLIGAHVKAGPKLSRVCDFLGRLSYPLYLVHYPIVSMFNTRLAHFHGLALAGVVTLEFVIPLVFAAFVLLYFDEPVRRWLSARLALHGSARLDAAVAAE